MGLEDVPAGEEVIGNLEGDIEEKIDKIWLGDNIGRLGMEGVRKVALPPEVQGLPKVTARLLNPGQVEEALWRLPVAPDILPDKETITTHRDKVLQVRGVPAYDVLIPLAPEDAPGKNLRY